MDYLVYVTHDAENLQFFLWMIDYVRRFQKAPKAEINLSPKWTFDEKVPRLTNIEKPSQTKGSNKVVGLMGTEEVDLNDSEDISNASTLEYPQSTRKSKIYSWKTLESPDVNSDEMAQLIKQSCDAQPFRKEINRIVSHYINLGSPRELNLSHEDRAAVVNALQCTTHPSALSIVKNILDMALRHRAHPNFIRWSICNGNTPRTFFLRGFAIVNIVIGILIATLFTLSSISRWFRIIAAVEWWFGITNLIAAYQGLCVLLLRRHTRNIRPWELNQNQGRSGYLFKDEEAFSGGMNIEYSETRSRWPVKMEVFGPPNNYLKESWIERHQRRSLWSKIKDRKVKVEETGLRILQNRIVRQAEAWALIVTIPLTAGFVALPKGNFY